MNGKKENSLNRFSLPIFLLFFFLFALNSYSLPECEGDNSTKWNNCEGTGLTKGGDGYKGEWKNGLPHGKGTFTWADGAKHVGEFKDGKGHGKGTWIHPDGDKYVGEYKNNKKHGKGTYTFANGEKYVGEWKDDKRHGQGTTTYSSGEKYVGEYKDGLPPLKEIKSIRSKISVVTLNLFIKLLPIASWGLLLTVLIVVPLSFIRGTQKIAITCLEVFRWVFGLMVWFYSCGITFATFGWIGLFIGLIFFGLGVVPLAIFGSFFFMHNTSIAVSILVMSIIVWATKLYIGYLVMKIVRTEENDEIIDL